MKDYGKKIRHIVPTYLWVSLGTVLLLVAGRYLTVALWGEGTIRIEVWDFWLPFLLGCVPALLWLRPRLRVLTYKDNAVRHNEGFYVLVWLVVLAMNLFAQRYVTLALGRLQNVAELREINEGHSAGYYRLADSWAVDEEYLGGYVDLKFEYGKPGGTYAHLYVAMPMRSKDVDVQRGMPKYWYGVKLKKKMHRKLKDEALRQAAYRFAEDTRASLQQQDLYDVDHFKRVVEKADNEAYFLAARNKFPQVDKTEMVVLEVVHEAYSDLKMRHMRWFFGSFLIGTTVFLLFLILPGYREPS